VSLAQLALAFAASEERFPVTLFGAASADEVRRNLAWATTPPDPLVVASVQALLEPLMAVQWSYRAATGTAPAGEAPEEWAR
jgi:aryl-alcohol dehydrogenase-like predicted oxidoreductase